MVVQDRLQQFAGLGFEKIPMATRQILSKIFQQSAPEHCCNSTS